MKIAMFAPYFSKPGGKFPNYFEYWQKSAGANSDIDFYIPTNIDTSRCRKYDNIHYLPMTDQDFWDKIQSVLDFPISHDYYKTGEYRILFGIIFKDIIREYDYWGYTELDMIYGDILKFVLPYLENGAEVIGQTAPFRLIKNVEKLNLMPFNDVEGFEHPLTLERALSEDYCWFFSETSGMNIRYYQAGIDVISLYDFFGDIITKFHYLTCIGMEGKWGFNWNNGKLIGYNSQNEQKEFMAIHLQKRRMETNSEFPGERFCIIPGIIIDGSENDPRISVPTLTYTIKFMFNQYRKMYIDNKHTSADGKLIWKELNEYIEKNNLSPFKNSTNAFMKLIRTIKNKLFWY